MINTALRKYIVISSLLLVGLLGSAQNALIDSLENAALSADPADKVKILADLCWEWGFTDTDKALEYGREAYEVAQATGEKELIAYAANDLGTGLYRKGDLKEAIDLYREAASIREELGLSRDMAASLSKIGLIYTEKQELDSAIHYTMESLRIFEEVGDSAAIGLSCNNLASIYEKEEAWDLTEKYAQRAYDIFSSVNYPYGMAGACGNMSNAFEGRGDYDSAIEWLNKSVELFEKVNSKLDMATAYNNLGVNYRKKGLDDEGLVQYQKALGISEEIGDQFGIAQYKANIGAILVDQEKFAEARTMYQEALEVSQNIGSHKTTAQCYEGLANALAPLGQADEALKFHRLYVAKKDSLYNEEKFAILADADARYENERTNRLLAEERASTAERDAQIQRSRLINYIAIGGIIALIFIAVLAISRQRERQRAALSQAESQHQQILVAEREKGLKAVFDATEQERQRIAKDLHDGIGQQLSGIKLSLSRLVKKLPEDESGSVTKLTDVVDQTAADVRTLSHQMMPRALQELGLVQAIDDMLHKSLSLGEVKYAFEHFNIEGKRFEKRLEIGVYRICQELVNNIIKHANAKEVVVQLFENRKSLILIVEDDGRGFDPEAKKDGIGLTNISSRLNTINGEVNWEPSPESGTTATIRIPIGS